MFKKILTALLIILTALTVIIYKNSLYLKISRITNGKDCKVSIALINGNKSWTYNNQKKPLLSLFKIFIAVKVLNKLENEKIDINSKIQIKSSMIDTSLYSPMVQKYNIYPYEISFSELLGYMISESDNNASDILLEYSGGTAELTQYIKDLGFENIDILVNEKEMNSNINNQYLNQATPYDVINFIKYARDQELLTFESQKFLDKIMLNTTTGNNKIKRGIPQNVTIGHKTGSSSRKNNGVKIADNDAGFVILPNGNTYYIAVMIIESALSDEENAELISGISTIVYNYVINNKRGFHFL